MVSALRNRSDELVGGVLPALGVVAAWLIPPTIYGILYMLVWEPAAFDSWPERLVDFCFNWGFAGVIVVPIAAFVIGSMRSGSKLTGASAALVTLFVYFPASLAAIMLILLFDPTFGPGGGWD